MNDARVFLIGGAPGAGKTTLSCALAARIRAASVTIDDLMSVDLLSGTGGIATLAPQQSIHSTEGEA